MTGTMAVVGVSLFWWVALLLLSRGEAPALSKNFVGGQFSSKANQELVRASVEPKQELSTWTRHGPSVNL